MSAVESFKKIRFSLSRDAEMVYYVKLRLLRRAFRGFVVEQTPPEWITPSYQASGGIHVQFKSLSECYNFRTAIERNIGFAKSLPI